VAEKGEKTGMGKKEEKGLGKVVPARKREEEEGEEHWAVHKL